MQVLISLDTGFIEERAQGKAVHGPNEVKTRFRTVLKSAINPCTAVAILRVLHVWHRVSSCDFAVLLINHDTQLQMVMTRIARMLILKLGCVGEDFIYVNGCSKDKLYSHFS
jgi:hypothetical protein